MLFDDRPTDGQALAEAASRFFRLAALEFFEIRFFTTFRRAGAVVVNPDPDVSCPDMGANLNRTARRCVKAGAWPAFVVPSWLLPSPWPEMHDTHEWKQMPVVQSPLAGALSLLQCVDDSLHALDHRFAKGRA
ncbi:MAG: hypothetical protein JNL84_11555 [Candidatus Accumulibacter sp.]|nr:hypothetical protein [Accumulibacter sp.]